MKTITIEAALEAITIEAGTRASAQDLCAALSRFRTDLIEADDGGQQVRVKLARPDVL